MQAYEFYATPENGFIKIPEQYLNYITSSVRVILLGQKPVINNKDETSQHLKSDLLLPPTMKTKNWKGGELALRNKRSNGSVWLRNLPQAVLSASK